MNRPDLPLVALERIESICSRFEDESGRGGPTQLESYLAGVQGEERSELLRELLVLDIELRKQRGHEPSVADYAYLASPDDQTVVRSAFEETQVDLDRVVPSDTAHDRSIPEAHRQLGPYSVRERLGEGGMGTVYLAEQHEPIERQVALKVVRSEIGSKQIVDRFEQERQALAVMDHPNIAKVLDAGASNNDEPYFVMELVDGSPITEYCDEHRMGIRERLEIFVQVCFAVQHAHQKGIIHRDLKPTNVLVAIYDEKPTPKVIDFGLATAIRDGLLKNSSETEIGTVLGTFQYMSPEQAEPQNPDVDTRADVYALGVMLYELLTGETPVSKESLRDVSLFEIMRRIREVEPRLPSRVARGSRYESMSRMIHGDLDWILLRALAKERSERYDTAAAFAEDLQRHLRDEPVAAGPPSRRYRIRKFVRRNRIPVAAACAVTLSLIAGFVLSTMGFLRARHERNLANAAVIETEKANGRLDAQLQETAAARDAEQAAKERAETKSATTFAVNQFLSDVIRSASPRSLGADATVREALDRAEEKIDGEFSSEPKLKSAVLGTLANTYYDLGEYRKAEDLARDAIQLSTEHWGPEHQNTLRAKETLASTLYSTNQLADAESLRKQLCEMTQRNFGPDDNWTLASKHNLAIIFQRTGRSQAALELFSHVLARRRELLGDRDLSTLSTQTSLALLQLDLGNKSEAVDSLRSTSQAYAEQLGPEHPDALRTLEALAFAQSFIDVRESIPIYHDIVEIQSRVLGEDHPEVMHTQRNLATALLGTGQPEEAEVVLRQMVDWNQANAAERGVAFDATPLLVQTLAVQEKGEEAEKLAREYLSRMEGRYDEKHPRRILAKIDLGHALLAQGRHEAAEPILQDCSARLQMFRGVGADLIATAQILLGAAHAGTGRFEEAERLLQQGHDSMQELKGPEHVLVSYAARRLIQLPTQ